MAVTANQVIFDTPAPEFRLPATDGKTYTLDDLAGGKAGGADANLLPGAVLGDDPGRLQIRKPPAIGPVVRVTDVVTGAGSFPADGADSGHGL